ncbi:hypothetical protein LIPSTDRAFT_335551 [Lipomyces starkeyi NRRL Y-11557]|uniref:Uncharacterized protein n=1 Tax=Lipomyces starkeyi NRRL Y-11557 TaxID=675824 RepID=A0A1E3QG00_LIPST|nr:hypothetical protein LIPSTDRAFT_335551 [Lipomyces starkeyi NRRL Y-11557]
MVRRKSLTAEDLDSRVTEAVFGANSGRYKSSYEAAKQLGLSRDTVTRRVNGGYRVLKHARHNRYYPQHRRAFSLSGLNN